jgi:hypothetical protein
MNNFSKMLVGSSLVLGAVLFSVGCGGDSFCCKDGEPPIPKIVGDDKDISLDGKTTHTFNALTTNGMDDGNIVKCNWYIDGKLQSYTGSSCSNVELNFDGMSGKPEVCLEVIDNDGISSKENNGKIKKDKVGPSSEKNGNLELRKKMDCKYVAITPENHVEPVAKISLANSTFMSGCPIATAADAGSTPGEGSITNYAWSLDGAELNDGPNELSLKYDDMNNLSIGEHKACLVVTNSLGAKSKPACETITVKEHKAPTAVLNVTGELDTVSSEGQAPDGTIKSSSTVKLSCKGSHDDCPVGERAIPKDGAGKTGECKFGGISYLSDSPDCSVVKTVYKDCSKVGEGDYNAHFGDVTDDGAGVSLGICGNTTLFNCVKLWVDVKDNFGGTSRAEKTFNVK